MALTDDDFDPAFAVPESEYRKPTAVADDDFDPAFAVPEEDYQPVDQANVPQGPDHGKLRRESFKMLNDVGRLSQSAQRTIADDSSGLIGGTLRRGKNLIGLTAESMGNTLNPWASPEAMSMEGAVLDDDLLKAQEHAEKSNTEGMEAVRKTLGGFVDYFKGNGITDGKEMMSILKDSVRENVWDPTTDDDARQLSDGTLRVNPKFVALPDAQEGLNAIDKSTAAPEAKDQAKQNFLAARKEVAASLDQKARGYDSDYKQWAEQQEAAGVKDPEQRFFSWPGLNRNWVKSSWDVVRDTAAEAGRGMFRTVESLALPLAQATGSTADVARISRNLLESSKKSQFTEEMAAARDQSGPVVGTGKQLGSTVLEMAPMFAGGAAGRLIGGAAEANAGRALLGKAVTGTGIYGWAAAQGYGSIMQTALEAADRKAAAEGREITDQELAKTVADNQGSAVANGFQTAILAKLLPEGSEATAAKGLSAAGMTGRELLATFRQHAGEGWREALKATKPQLVEFAKDAYKAAKVGFTDEALEEGVNQYLEGVITKLGGADADKTWDQIGQETWTGTWQGGVIGGGLPAAQQTLGKRDVSDLAVQSLLAGAQEAAPKAVAAVAGRPNTPDTTTEGSPDEEAPLPEQPADSPEAVNPPPNVVEGAVEPVENLTSETNGPVIPELPIPAGELPVGTAAEAGVLPDTAQRELVQPAAPAMEAPGVEETIPLTDETGTTAPTIGDPAATPTAPTPVADGGTTVATPEGEVDQAVEDVHVPVAKEAAYSREALKETFNLDDDQATAADALVQALGLDTSSIRVKKGGTPGQGLAEGDGVTLKQGKTKAKGSFEVLKDGDALIRGLVNPDVSTAVHEISHVARRQLLTRGNEVPGITPQDIEVAEQWAGAKDGKWDVAAEEKFARGFERYLRDGTAPAPELATIFDRIGEWLKSIYKSIKGTSLDVKITPEMRAVLDAMVKRNAAAPSPSENLSTPSENAAPEGETSPAPPTPEPTAKTEPSKEETPKTEEKPAPEADVIGIRKAMTDAYREANGLLSSTLKVGMGDQEAIDQASQRIAEHAAWEKKVETPGADPGPEPLVGQALIAHLANNPGRASNKVERALLTHELLLKDKEVIVARNKAKALPDSATVAERLSAEEKVDRALQDVQLVLDTLRMQNSMSGLALQAAKLVVNRSYELVQMLTDRRRWENAGRKPGTKEVDLTEAQKAEVEALHERITAAEKALDDFKEQKAREDAERTHKAEEASRRKAKPKVRRSLGAKIEEAKKRLREQGLLGPETEEGNDFLAQEALPEQTLQDLATFGASWIVDKDAGIDSFKRRLTKTFGPQVAGQAEAIYDRAKEILNAEMDAAVAETTDEKTPRTRKTKEEIVEDIDEAKGPSGKDVFQLARIHLNAGVEGFENTMGAVLKDLQTKFPDLTLREVHDAYSGYGKTIRPSSDKDLVALREYRSLARLMSQLEDASRSIPPKRTGLQRDKATERVRTLQKQVKEVMRKMGIKATSSKSLATALDAVKTRLKNEIEELDTAIKNQTPRPEKGAPVAYDTDATDLKKQRDALKKEYDALFPKEDANEDDLIDAAEKSLDRRIEENEELIRKGLSKKPANPKDREPWSKGISERRAKLEDLLKQRKALRDSQAERLERAKKLTQKRTEKIRKRIDEGDYETKSRDPIIPDKKLAELRLEEFKAKREWDRKRAESLLAKKSMWEKAKYYGKSALGLQRVIKLGGEFGVVARQLFPFTAKAIWQPKAYLDVIRKAGASTFSRAAEESLYEQWTNPESNPDAIWYKDMGIVLHGPHSEHTGFKEDIPDPEYLEKMTELKGKMRVLGYPAEVMLGIERFTRTAINAVRVVEAHNLIQAMRNGTPTMEEAKVIGNAVMNSTGRYAFKNQRLETYITPANTITISARWALSRMAILTGQPLWTSRGGYRGTGKARWEIAKEVYGKPMAGYAALAVLAAMALGRKKEDEKDDGSWINLDPGLSFGQGSLFGRQFDFHGGMRPYLKLAKQFLQQWGHNVNPEAFDAPEADLDNSVKRFIENRRNPIFAWAYDTMFKDTYYGKREKNVVNSLDELVTPVIGKDAYNLYTADDLNAAEATVLFMLLQAGASMPTQPTKR